MLCPSCGKQFSAGYSVCPFCGKVVGNEPVHHHRNSAQQPQYQQPQYQQPQYQQPQYQQPQYQQPQYQQPQGNYAHPRPAKVSFGEAIKLFFTNYANFEGRATVSEYWFAMLFQFLVYFGLGLIPFLGWGLLGLVSLGFLIPSLSIAIRRIHDTGKPWTYYLMGLIPFAGFIILIIQFCKESDGDNQWGPAPRG